MYHHVIREFFTTVREGSSPQEELPSPHDSTTHHTHGGARGGGGSQQARERGTRVTSTRATTSECATTSDECAAQSFARALRAYHGTLSPRWGPTSDQCEIVRARAARLPWNARPPVGLSPTSSGSVPAPSSRPIQERAASCSSPPAQPPRCGATARSEKINLAVGQKSTNRGLQPEEQRGA